MRKRHFWSARGLDPSPHVYPRRHVLFKALISFTAPTATKEFRQSNSPDLSSFKSLLKAYQAEIDALSKASKRSEEVVQSLHDGLKDVGGNLEGQLEDDGGDGDGEEVKGLREENKRLKAAAAEAEGSSEGLREEVRERRGGVFLFRFLFCLISFLLTLLFSLPLPHSSNRMKNSRPCHSRTWPCQRSP